MVRVVKSLAVIVAVAESVTASASSEIIDFDAYQNAQLSGTSVCGCSCVDERDGTCSKKPDNFCYTPLCPSGFYLCCATCGMSTCVQKLDMFESSRGVKECLLCPPGFFCDGCDLPVQCEEGTVNRRYGMSQSVNCQECPSGFRINDERTQCCDTVTGTCTAEVEADPYSNDAVRGASILPHHLLIILGILIGVV